MDRWQLGIATRVAVLARSTSFIRIAPAVLAFGILWMLHDKALDMAALVVPAAERRCPSPWLSAAPESPPVFKCGKVESNSSDWSIALCYNTLGCNEGYVDVEYLDSAACTELEGSRRTSEWEPQNVWIKSNLGPHTLSVLFDGAARFGIERPDEYSGNCRYRYPFRLFNGGPFTLRVVLVYDDYRGLDSLHQEEWQPIVNRLIVPDAVLAPPEACPPNCPRYTHSAALEASAHLPLCQPDDKIEGVWLPIYNHTEMPALEWKLFPSYTWLPQNCRLNTLLLDNHAPEDQRATCFTRPHNVLLAGDSHIRWLYDSFVTKAYGTLVGDEPLEPKYFKAEEKNCQIGKIQFNFAGDVAGLEIKEGLVKGNNYQKHTHIVVGFVQWLMHQPYQEYTAHIDTVLERLRTFQAGLEVPVRVIWFQSPAWPHRDDEDVRSHNDTRTNARLQQMNDYASAAFRAEGYTAIDNFALTIPMVHNHESVDNAHWYHSRAMVATENLVAHHLNLCG